MLTLFRSSFIMILLLGLASSSCQSSTDTQTSNDPSDAFADIDVAAFSAKIGTPNTVLLDVRTPAETSKGIIEGAIEIDYKADNFATKIEQLDKDKTYLVYCASGGRSGNTMQMMSDLGFSSAYNLVGGYRAWAAAQK